MDACCSAAGPSAGPLYAQMLTTGLAWVLVHCIGMCGPLVAGLGFGRGRGWARGAAELGLYQAGRLLPLAAAGALAGWLAGESGFRFAAWAPWAVLAVALGMLAAAAVQLGWLPWFRGDGTLAARLVRPVAGWTARHPLPGFVLLGAVLSVLPCGVVFWALALAAVSGDPLHGAALLSLLVLLTTLPLGVAAALGGLAWGRLRSRLGGWVPPLALALSAAWMSLHAGAMLRWWPHAHLGPVMLF